MPEGLRGALLCARGLVFAKRGEPAREIVVGVAAPHAPGERFAVCRVCLGDPLSLHEVYAADALGALGAALAAIDGYLARLAELGDLAWPGGRRYDAGRDAAVPARAAIRPVSDAIGRATRSRTAPGRS